MIEGDIGIKLGDKIPTDWIGWLTYRNKASSLIVCRGRAFAVEKKFGKTAAGPDSSTGAETVLDFYRGYDVNAPQDIDHLLINFGVGAQPRIFIWYGEKIAAYKLIYETCVDEHDTTNIQEAVVQACEWIINRPNHLTLSDWLRSV
jgi:hypothetical protein